MIPEDFSRFHASINSASVRSCHRRCRSPHSLNMSKLVTLGLLQTHADAKPAVNLERTLHLAHKAADRGRADYFHSRTFRIGIFLPIGRSRLF